MSGKKKKVPEELNKKNTRLKTQCEKFKELVVYLPKYDKDLPTEVYLSDPLKLKKIKNVTRIDPKDECVICMSTKLRIYYQLSCGHFFHSYCIRQWVTDNLDKASCPFCRKPIEYIKKKHA